jgi:hypothetical protein
LHFAVEANDRISDLINDPIPDGRAESADENESLNEKKRAG